VVFGYFGYIIVRGVFDRHGIDIVIGLVMALCFAYEFTGIVPGAEDVSWQGHLFGFITGIVGGWIFRERRPKPHADTDPAALAGPTTPPLGPTKPAL
jgi:membrane associated rhomboid family serine protease